MPRFKEYDKEKVLEKATQLFLKKGFKGTSMNALVAVTGLHRRSMYTEFKDKEGLFLACIDNYLNSVGEKVGVILRQEPQGIGNIETFFRDRIAYASSGSCKGCLIVNTTVEKESISKQIEEKILKSLQMTEKEFYKCLQAAKKKGELGPTRDCKSLAKYLMCFLQGLMVMGKTNPPKKSLEPVLDSVLGAL